MSLALHALQALVFALACHGAGWWFVRRLPSPSPLVTAAVATGLGYGIVAQVLFFLARFGLLTQGNVIAVVALAAAASLVSLPRIHPLIVLAAIPSFVLALYPPVGYDATMYHLVYAKLFAEEGRLVWADALRFPVFPQLGEMPFAAALLVADESAAQLTQWVTHLAAAAVIPGLFPEERRGAAPLAVALFLGTPYAVYLAGNAYIDVSFTMAATMAFVAWVQWRRTDRAGWLALAGAFSGMAAATKYHGLLIGLLFVLALIRSRRALVLFVTAAAIFAVPTYAHITLLSGSPVFPLGHPEYAWITTPVAPWTIDPFVTLVRYAIVWPIQMGMPPHSPWLVMLLPFGVAGWFLAPRLRVPLTLSVVLTLATAWHDPRYGLPAVPVLAAAVAIGLDATLRSRYRRALALLFLLPGFAWGTILIGKFGRLPTDAGAFVESRIPIVRAIRAAGVTTTYVLGAPNAAYYCPGRCLGDFIGPYRYALIEPLLNDPAALTQKLQAFGATRLVVAKPARALLPKVFEDETAVVYAVGERGR